jgi:CheY-like chemotaxis protein
MVLSDINMPRMGGFELLRRVEEDYPRVKRVLMTAYNLDDYMRMVRDHNVGNVIAKTTPLDFKELKDILSSLLHESIFGVDRYMQDPFTRREFLLQEPSQIDAIADAISAEYPANMTHQKLRVVLFELMTNALFYGARSESGDNKQEWVRDFRLPEDQAVLVTACVDGEKMGVSVLDRGGKLDKHTVLYWLDRQTTHDETGLPHGIFDFHGRGFFITRKYVDRFLINIEKGKRCECCVFHYFESKFNTNKPLLINEI